MARILIAYKEFPAPSVGHAGGQSVYRLIELLHRRGHQITLVARLRTEEAPLVDEVVPVCEQIITVPHHRSLPGPFPVAFLRSYVSLRRAVARALDNLQPDLLFIEFAQTAVFLLGLRRPFTSFRPHDINWYLLDQQAAQSSGVRRGLTLAASALFRWFEPWLCRRFDQVVAISEGDRQLLAPRCGDQAVLLLPLAPAPATETEVSPAVPPGPNLLFVGAMYRSFNIQAVQWFLEGVWPQVVSRIRNARFYIVGYNPPSEIRACHDGESVFVTGFVDDLAPWYRAASVFVSPLLVAGGLLQKILDALAMKVPVVATSVSNHGVGATPGEHLLVADDPSDFADAVVHIMENQSERERLSQAGYRFVHQQYDLERAVARWEQAWRLKPTP